MDRDTAIQRIQRGLGFRTDLSSEIALAMQEQQRLLEMGKTLPWFLLDEDASLAVIAATRTVALPNRFLRISEEDGIWYEGSDGVIKLVKRPFAEAIEYYSGDDPGSPVAYSLRKDTIYLFPEPDIAYTLTWSPYIGAELLTTNVENAWLANAPDVLIGAAGISIATDLRDATAVQTFTALYSASWDNLMREVAAREEQDMPRALGRNN